MFGQRCCSHVAGMWFCGKKPQPRDAKAKRCSSLFFLYRNLISMMWQRIIPSDLDIMIIRKHKFLRIGDEFPLLVLWLFYSGMMIDKPYLSLAISGGVPCFGIRVMLEVFVLETEGDFGMPSEHAAFVMYLFSQPVRKKRPGTPWKEENRWKNRPTKPGSRHLGSRLHDSSYSWFVRWAGCLLLLAWGTSLIVTRCLASMVHGD